MQLPNEDWEPFDSNVKIVKSECVRQEINVKFNYLSLELGHGKIENLDSNMFNRKMKIKDDSETKKNSETMQNHKNDPLKWFGFLVPNSLKQSQKHFSKGIELVIEATNIQNEIGGVMARRQYLIRHLKKLENTEEILSQQCN